MMVENSNIQAREDFNKRKNENFESVISTYLSYHDGHLEGNDENTTEDTESTQHFPESCFRVHVTIS